MKLRYSPRATADLEDIADYLRSKSPQGAKRVRAAILATLKIIARFPRMGRRQTVGNVRKLGVRKYPYLIYYRLDEAVEETLCSPSATPPASAALRTPERP